MSIPEWMERMDGVRLIEAAQRLGYATGRRVVARCPACHAERPAERGGRVPGHGGRGIGVSDNGLGGRCFACREGFNAFKFVCFAIAGRAWRSCDTEERRRIREWCLEFLGMHDGTRPRGKRARAASHVRPATSARVAPLAPVAPVPEAEADAPRYPPIDEVMGLLRRSKRVDLVPETAAYLRACGIDPSVVADRGLAYALPDMKLPSWAYLGAQSWYHTQHKLLVPMYDMAGVLRSVSAKRLIVGEPKSLPPKGYDRKRLVMADRLGRAMLRNGPAHPSTWIEPESDDHPFGSDSGWWPAELPFRLTFCEGEKDLCCWGSEFGDADPYAPAVIGVLSGSWTREHATRIPAGTEIMFAPDNDPSGDSYTTGILNTLKGMPVPTPKRWRPQA